MLAACVAWAAVAAAQSGGSGERAIGRTTEREIKVVISSAFGNVKVARCEPGKIVVAEADEGEEATMKVSYTIRNRIGYLEIILGEPGDTERSRGVLHIRNLESGSWTLRFGTAVPISFDIEQAVGKGDYDLSGLQVKDFTLSSGASDIRLAFNEPNSMVIDNLSIESGLSKFTGFRLGNANFKRFRFQGGVGSSTLDFSGDLESEVDVDVEIGLGALTILVPPETGAQVFYDEGWMSRFDYDRDFSKVGATSYSSDNYSSARGRMNIRIDAGLGSVKLRRP